LALSFITMESKEGNNKMPTSRDQLLHLAKPGNIARTVLSAAPGGSAIAEVMNQLEGQKVDRRMKSLEDELRATAEIMKSQAISDKPISDWPKAANQFIRRRVEIAVLYNRSFSEYIVPVAYGCLLDDSAVLTCVEATELAARESMKKNGKVIMISGLRFYEFELGEVQPCSGLVVCKLKDFDKIRFKETEEIFKPAGINITEYARLTDSLKYTVTPWIGQEVAFISSSESTDNLRMFEFSRCEFVASLVSYFKRPKDKTLKSFVTSVLGVAVHDVGSAVFSRDSTLLGIIAGTEKHPGDVGVRVVVKSLLGCDRFTNFLKNS
jgi:hypothetical protein